MSTPPETTHVLLSLPTDIHDRLARMAATMGMTMPALIESIVVQWDASGTRRLIEALGFNNPKRKV